MNCSYSPSTDLISISNVHHKKKWQECGYCINTIHLYPKSMHTVPLNIPSLLESRYAGNCVLVLPMLYYTCFLCITGLGMGLRRSVVGMATILAPLWTGSTITMPYIMLGVMLALLLLSLVSRIV